MVISLDLPKFTARQIALIAAFLIGFSTAKIIDAQIKTPVVLGTAVIAGISEDGQLLVKSGPNPSDVRHRLEVYYGPSLIRSREGMLKALQVEIFLEDQVSFLPEPSVGLGSKITINRATPVKVNDGGEQRVYRTFKESVKEVLGEQGILLRGNDKVDPAPDAEVWWNGRIIITRVDEAEFFEVQEIPYTLITRDDPAIFFTETRVVHAGRKGRKELHVKARRENGREVAREILSEEMLAQPVDRVVARGIKPRPAQGRWEDLINEIAPRYGADPAGLTTIMLCESGGNLTSYNPAGPYYGMFQFDEYTFTNIGGYPMSEIYDAPAQIDAAAKLYSARYWHWPVCSRGT